MPRAAKKDWTNVIIAAVAACGFLGGAIYNGLSYTDKLATKPYVDDRFIDAKKYADERSNAVLEKAIAHSDANHSDMMFKMSEFNSDSKSTVSIISTKVDAILNRLNELQSKQWTPYSKSK